MRLNELPLGDFNEREINAVVEIPKGSKNKYEYSPAWDSFLLDRVLPGPLQFPTAYGFLPRTIGPDGDEIDVLIIQGEPVPVGVILKVRPVGMFNMEWPDSDKRDDKILAVSVNDPLYNTWDSLDDLPEHLCAELDYFFRSYLSLESLDIKTEWGDADDAWKAILDGHAQYKKQSG